MKRTKKVLLFLLLFLFFYYFYFWWYSYFYSPPSLNSKISLQIPQEKLAEVDFEVLEVKEGEDKVYLLLPKNLNLNSSPVVLFFHGLNIAQGEEVIQSGGLMHLVKNGNILIVPIYEKSLFSLFSSEKLLKKAEELANLGMLKIKEIVPENDFSKFAILGFSLGGAVATNFPFEKFPKASALILIAPAETFPLFPSRIFGVPFANPKRIPQDIFLVGILAEKDRIVNFKLVKKFFFESKTPQKYLFQVFSDNYGTPPLLSNHKNIFLANDFLNIYGVFNLIDKTLECAFENKNCEVFKEKTIFLGKWSDGREIRRIAQVELK